MSQSAPLPPDCLRCGTCCFSELQTYVRVTGDDHARLGDLAETYVRFEGNKAYMTMEEGHCAALELREDGSYVCRLYEVRPQTCRDLDRGSPSCEAEIELKGQRPLIALRVLHGASPHLPSRSEGAREEKKKTWQT